MTGSEFKFLRRVRIHDGECGAVARALHHAAQKVALVRNEQSLISDECIPLRQAGSEKASDSTFNERKQMSTKTSIKRIALVAVSALGFGLMSVMPANAAADETITAITIDTETSTDVAVSGITAGVITVVADIAETGADSDTADMTNVAIQVLVSQDSDIPTGLITKADVTGVVNETETAANGADTISYVFEGIENTGLYSFRVFDDSDGDAAFTAGEKSAIYNVLVTAADLASYDASVAATSLSVAGNALDVDGTASDITLTATALPTTTTATIKVELVGAPAASLSAAVLSAGDVLSTTSSGAITFGAQSAGVRTVKLELASGDDFDDDGYFTLKIFADNDADGVADATEPQRTVVVHREATTTDMVSAARTPAATTSVQTATSASRYGVTDNPIIAVIRDSQLASANNSTGDLKLRVNSSPDVDLPAGTVIKSSLDNKYLVSAVGDTRYFEILAGNGIVAATGSYEFTAWADADSDDVIDSSERSAAVSYVVGGAAKGISVAFDKSTFVAGDNTQTANVTVTLTDVDGNPATGSPTITFAPTTAGTMTTPLAQVGTSNVYAGVFTAGASSVAGSVTATVAVTGATSGTTTLTMISLANATELFYNGAAGISTGNQTRLNSASATDTMTVDTVASTVYFTAKVAPGDGGKYIQVTTTPAVSTSASSVSTSGITYVKTNADGTITFPVVVTSPSSTTGYTLTLEAGATDLTYTVGYAVVTPTMTLAPVANGGTVKAKYGDKLDMVATLTDQWLRPMADKTITITIPSTSRNPQTVNRTTDAAGKVTFSLTDTFGASATKTSDVITFTYSYLATATATAATNLQRSATVTYTATGPVVGSVAVTTATTADEPIDQAEEVSGSPATASRLVYTATVKDANGVAAGSGILVTFTGGADDKFLDGVATGVTDANGVATVAVYRQKVGFAAITASAGGKSGSAIPVRWINAAADARNVAVAVEPTSIVSEGTATVKATVTDRWGNGVAGITVTFAETGAGRLTATTATTNTAGVAQVDFTSAKNETGSNTITAVISGGQSANRAGFVGTTEVAGVTAGNTSATAAVTVTKDTSVSTADALLELAKAIGTGNSANAAADAALEAIDAANAATDAANLAAEAADAATVAAEEARDAADAATAAVEALASEVATLVAALKAQITTLANTVAKIAKRVRA